MVYRTYIDSGNGYKPLGSFIIKSLLITLDYLILVQNIDKRIIVVEESKENDFPIFLYTGDIEDYQKFRKEYVSKVKRL